jgi:hypothetical protein
MSEERTTKLRELILYISDHAQRDPCYAKTKLNKILFYADFIAYRRWGRSITEQEYKKLPFGPVPRDSERTLLGMREDGDLAIRKEDHYGHPQERPVSLRNPDLRDFSAEEIALVQQVIEDVWEMTATEVSDLSHRFIGWKAARLGEVIPYETALVFRRPQTPEEAQYGVDMAKLPL